MGFLQGAYIRGLLFANCSDFYNISDILLQMQTSFLLQGLGMDLHITNNFKAPPASLSLFDIIIILLLIPFMDRIFYPLCRKLNIRLTSLRKMGIGMVFAIISLIVAALIEVRL